MYPNSPCDSPIWPGLFIADPNAMYGLKGEPTIIALSAYIDVLVCRPSIIEVGMPYEYSLQRGGSIKLGKNKDIVPSSMVCVTTWLTGKLVGCDGGIAIPGVVVETNVWLMPKAVTPMVVKVFAPPTVILIGWYSAFEALFRGGGTLWGDEFLDGLDILINLPLLRHINTQ